MSGEPLVSALRAAKTVVQNLRREDNFALITFDDAASVVIPMGPVSSKQAVLDRIDSIQTGGSTNLTGGWMLGRDERGASGRGQSADCNVRGERSPRTAAGCPLFNVVAIQ